VQQCTGATRLVDLVLSQRSQKMSLIPDQGAVEQYASASADPPLHDRVAPHRQLHLIRTIGTDASG